MLISSVESGKCIRKECKDRLTRKTYHLHATFEFSLCQSFQHDFPKLLLKSGSGVKKNATCTRKLCQKSLLHAQEQNHTNKYVGNGEIKKFSILSGPKTWLFSFCLVFFPAFCLYQSTASQINIRMLASRKNYLIFFLFCLIGASVLFCAHTSQLLKWYNSKRWKLKRKTLCYAVTRACSDFHQTQPLFATRFDWLTFLIISICGWVFSVIHSKSKCLHSIQILIGSDFV